MSLYKDLYSDILTSVIASLHHTEAFFSSEFDLQPKFNMKMGKSKMLPRAVRRVRISGLL